MKTKEIIKNLNPKHVIGNFEDVEIENLAFDTRDVEEGTLFFCLKGQMFDGHNFAGFAMEKGAKALVVERPLFVDLPQVVVEDSRKALSICASNFWGNPEKKLKLVGVTGTNGKTTTTYILKSILEEAGHKVGVIGTIGIVIDGKTYPAKLTTPDPTQFFEILNKMTQQKVDYAVMEVSAHAIALQKLYGVKFDVGILTNVTQDHLDYFKTFESYKQTKKNFLKHDFCQKIVVNVDDECGKEIFLQNKEQQVLSYGLKNPSDVFAVKQNFSLDGTECFVNLFDDVFEIKTKLCGEFNLYNALGAITASKVLGIDNKSIMRGLENMNAVEGRFNVIDLGQNKKAVLDYAHTPDGLKNILSSTRLLSDGKIISVFGCGGNRDTKKRSIMGEISGALADFSIITSDNPRFEEPSDIISQIEKGMKTKTQNYVCIENRRDAIACGLKKLESGDVLVVSGKGAENYLDIKGVKYPYSDRETILEENNKLKKEQELL